MAVDWHWKVDKSTTDGKLATFTSLPVVPRIHCDLPETVFKGYRGPGARRKSRYRYFGDIEMRTSTDIVTVTTDRPARGVGHLWLCS